MVSPLVLAVIAQFQALHDKAVEQYTCGDCYRFGQLLQRVFPDARLWYDTHQGHVLVEVSGWLYDITGAVHEVWRVPDYVYPWHAVEPRVRSGAPFWRWRPHLKL